VMERSPRTSGIPPSKPLVERSIAVRLS